MAMQVEIPDELAEHLEKQAEAVGSVPEQIAVAAIRRQIQADEQLDQMLAPVREAFEVSGMTEEELGDMLEKAKHDMRGTASTEGSMRTPPDKVVFDCNVFAQAIISKRGPTHACLDLARSGEIWLVWSDYIIQEIIELPWKLPTRLNISERHVHTFIRRVAEYAELVEEVPEVYKLLEDEDDSPYINLALAAGAELITSRDRHMLGLMDPSKPGGQEFRRRFPDLVILRPEQLLQRMREEMDS